MSWAGAVQTPLANPPQTPVRASNARTYAAGTPTLICLSHLRWGFVYQRPQHLMVRFARDCPVLYVEEPLSSDTGQPWLETQLTAEGVQVLVPRVPAHWDDQARLEAQRQLLDAFVQERGIDSVLLWYYTPMSLAFTAHLKAEWVVYDCMDELSAFKGAPAALVEWEKKLLARADLVFTGGYSLFEAKQALHGNVHPFPSSVDIAHFARARVPRDDPPDLAGFGWPRLGFYGVIDERLDLALLDQVAEMRPQWQFVLLGPVVKIDPASLPQRPNLHYLGGKAYDQLPDYLAGWDVALMPFALNASTRFISPTKTPEYLAGGRPVVSTPIADVVSTYGDTGLVRIAASAPTFIAAIHAALRDSADPDRVQAKADCILGNSSWDSTWGLMKEKIQCAMAKV